VSGGQAGRVRGSQVERVVRAGLEVVAARQARAAGPGRAAEQRLRRAASVWTRVHQASSDGEVSQALARLADLGVVFLKRPGGGEGR
jgi:hypothetical protein